MFEIGSSLREARIRQQLDFPEIEAGTKIRQKYLRALEDERFEVLPAHPYIKGFLRAYADFLGLDGGLYVDEYNSRFVVGEEEPPLRARRAPAPRRRASRRFEANVVVLALTAIALVTGLVIAAWKFGGPEQTNVQGLETMGTTRAAAPSTPEVAPLIVTATEGESRIEVRANGPGGPLLHVGTLELGQSKSFTGKRIYLRVGRPRNVTVVVHGQSARLPANWGAFLVTPDGLKRYRSAR